MGTVELVGDSARGDAYAAVRLVVDGDRIVEADASGLARPVVGLTLLEAAAVPGETLAADALANALGPALLAAPDPGRVAVAMSGGVDSAVTLLRAAPNAVGVTLRLWVDPHGPDVDRVCCSPAAVVSARETCHARGLPHVTLDLREEFRRSVVAPFVEGYAAGLTPNPCNRCNGTFRFHELVAFARRAGAAALWTGHYARVVERDGTRLVARAADPREGPVLHACHRRSRRARGCRLSTRRSDEGRHACGSGGGRAPRCASAREPGGLFPRWRRLPSLPPARRCRRTSRSRSWTRTAPSSGGTTASGASRRVNVAGIGVSGREPLYAIRTEASTATAGRRPEACRLPAAS